MVNQKQASKTPHEERDSWQTPPWLFDWLNHRFGFHVDTAATKDNAMVDRYFTKSDDGLSQDWRWGVATMAWCNPPYSNIDPWLQKAVNEAQQGVTTAVLIPTPNGEERYGDHVFGVASELIFITGRIAFISAQGKPAGGNTRGSCIAIYAGHSLGDTRYRHVFRDEIKREFEQ